MNTALVFAVSAVSAALAGPTGDLAKLQGRWELVSSETDRVKFPTGVVITYSGDEFTSVRGKAEATGKIKLDEKATPKAIDIIRPKEKPRLGIYSIEGDTHKVCFAPPGQPRPKEITTRGGNVVSVWKRAK